MVGLGISEPSTVGSMEQKRYLCRSMNGWFLWHFHVGKYTVNIPRILCARDSKGIKCQVWKKGLLLVVKIPWHSMFNRKYLYLQMVVYLVVSNVFYVHPYLGKWSHWTNILQMGWNHQLVVFVSLSCENLLPGCILTFWTLKSHLFNPQGW